MRHHTSALAFVRASAMADAAATIEEELEALEALYPDDGLVVRRASDGRDETSEASPSDRVHHTTVSLDVAPRTLDDTTQQFVRATLTLTLNNNYPVNAPSISLTNARGLDDTRQSEVFRRLETALDDFASPDEPVLALLCETAFETLTEMNTPDGDCAFCLNPVADAGDLNSQKHFMKLMRCYHCFHQTCFARWWRWKTNAAAREMEKLGAHHSAASTTPAPATHLCPVCRVAIEKEDVRHVKLDGEDENLDDASTSEKTFEKEKETIVSSAERARRGRFAKEMARQKAKGGLIEEGAGEFVITAGARASSRVETLNTHSSGSSGSSGGSIPKPNLRSIPKLKPKPKGGLGWLKKAAGAHADSLHKRAGALDVNGDETKGKNSGRGRGRGGRERGSEP